MLKKIRLLLAIACFTMVTMLFLDFTGTAHTWFGWMAKVQFLPAVMALNVVVILALCFLTFVFGRIYCSVICPLGVMQDIVSWIRRRRKKGRNKYSYSPEKRWLRYGILAVFIIAIIIGIGSLVALLAPYSSYGRIANNLFLPFYQWGNNILAAIAEHYDSYAFYPVDVWVKSLPTLLIASVTFAVIVVLAWRNGRTYCNTLCPVGTTLSFIARFSLFKVHFDKDKCRNCSLCTKNCKSSCIDFKNHTVDYSRCVVCGNCVSQCKFGALRYGPTPLPLHKGGEYTPAMQNEKTTDGVTTPPPCGEVGRGSGGSVSRRSFLAIAGTVTVGAALSSAKNHILPSLVEGSGEGPKGPLQPLTPPGSLSADNMARHCTGCQLCVTACPNGVLRPSEQLMTLMQPTMSYERGFCRPECTKCSEACPAGAIRPITKEEKAETQIGHAILVKKNCLSLNGQAECGNCERHCPTLAIQMMPSVEDDWDSPLMPVIDTKKCIGCGACENLCPAHPSAIYVEGYAEHQKVQDKEPIEDEAPEAPDVIPCIACGQCMPCPYGLDIPAIFTFLNTCARKGTVPSIAQPEEEFNAAKRAFLISYDRSVPPLQQANHCIGCGRCVPNCPKEIDIPREMMQIDDLVEKLKRR